MNMRLDQDQMDQIIGELRRDAVFVTQGDLTSALGSLMKSLKSGSLKTPNHSGGANSTEIVAKIRDRDLQVGEVTSTILTATAAAPTSGTDAQISIGQADSASTTATLDIRTEEVVVVIGTFVASHKLAIWINNVAYHINLDAV